MSNPRLLIRLDDIGMCTGVNQGTEELLKLGIPLSLSIMWCCPKWSDAVEMIKKYNNVSIGVHLVINSEWSTYKWVPISPANTVSSLVTDAGFFRAEFVESWATLVNVDELEVEIRAQIERALSSGLQIDYVDGHMIGPLWFSTHKKIVEKLAKEYDLGIENSYNEIDVQYKESVDTTTAISSYVEAMSKLSNAKPNRIIVHPGTSDSLMNTLKAEWEKSEGEIGPIRQNNVAAIKSPEFRQAILANKVELIQYRSLIEESRMINE